MSFAATIVSLSQPLYTVAEKNMSLTGAITLSNETSQGVIVEVTLNDGSANDYGSANDDRLANGNNAYYTNIKINVHYTSCSWDRLCQLDFTII